MLVLPSRGADWRIKPPQWGPTSAVQSSVKRQADAMGIDADSVLAVYPFWNKGGHNLLGSWSDLAFTGAQTLSPSLNGIGYDYDGSTTYAMTSNRLPQSYSVCYLFEPNLTTFSSVLCQSDPNSATYDWMFYYTSTSDGVYRYYYKSGGYISFTTDNSSNFNGSPLFLCGVRNVNAVSAYVNGELTDSNNISGFTQTYDFGVRTHNNTAPAIALLCLITAEPMSTSQIALLYEQPYRLLYPARRPIIFDVGAGATSLTFPSLSSDTQVATSSLSLLRALGLENAEISTQVSALAISLAVRILSELDIASDTLVTAATVQAIREILYSDVSTLSQITDVAMEVARTFSLTDVQSQSQVVSATLNVIRAILTDGVASSTSITDTALEIARAITTGDVSALTQVDPVTMNRIRALAASGPSSLTEVTDLILSVAGVVNVGPEDVSSSTQVAAIALEVWRQITFSEVASSTQLTDAALEAIRTISLAGISSTISITTLTVDTAKRLGITDAQSLSTITSLVISACRAFSLVDVNVATEVDPVSLSIVSAYTLDEIGATVDSMYNLLKLVFALLTNKT